MSRRIKDEPVFILAEDKALKPMTTNFLASDIIRALVKAFNQHGIVWLKVKTMRVIKQNKK